MLRIKDSVDTDQTESKSDPHTSQDHTSRSKLQPRDTTHCYRIMDTGERVIEKQVKASICRKFVFQSIPMLFTITHHRRTCSRPDKVGLQMDE